MHRLQGTLRRVAGFGVFGVAASAVLASGGCSSDDSGSNNTTMDASSDQTAPLSDASHLDSAADTRVPDSSAQDGAATNEASADGASDAMEHDAPIGDAAADVSPVDSSADVTPVDSGVDASPADSSVGDAADSSTSTDGSSGSDASVADAAACVTSVAALSGGDGGANDAGVAPKMLFNFDPSADGGDAVPSGASGYTASGSAAVTVTTADGHPCPGALSINVTYTSLNGQKQGVYLNYTTPQDWTGYATLHAWLKVVTTNYADFTGVEPRVDSGGYAEHLFGGFVNATTLADGGWHETVVPLVANATSYVPALVNGIQFELDTVSGDAGPPPQTTLLVDSIWIE